MLVSDLIRFRDNLLDKIAKLNHEQEIIDSCNLLNLSISENLDIAPFIAHEKILNFINELQREYNQSIDAKKILLTAIDDTNRYIDTLAIETLSGNENTPSQSFFRVGENNQYLKFTIDSDVETIIKSCIHRFADWHFPAIQLGCRYSGEENTGYTYELVSNDPLYLCDFNNDLINKTSSQFNEIYNNRLRKYVIVNDNVDQLPHNQFGFILSWMFFNFANIAVIKSYLSSLIKLLRPGGTLMFSYNNCDLVESAILAESGYMSFVPKRKLIEICIELGYNIVQQYDLKNSDHQIKYISWIEIQKPGVLSTIKRAQASGKILSK
jgi:SAM-dependent methyltransferase